MTDPQIFDYDTWGRASVALAAAYRAADPFPHVVLDDFLVGTAAARMADEFPDATGEAWIRYQHVNENKLGRRDRETFGPTLQAAIDELSSSRFIAFLESVTGVGRLLADPLLEGGGLHQSGRGGFLNVHADFTVHPHRPRWRRRVNVLVYLNEGWRDEWGGHLELWDSGVTRAVQRISPRQNRVVIFNTDESAFHGHPDPTACPPGHSRKSIALYYFTEEAAPVRARSTEYRARPGDGPRSLLIYADKMALRAYDIAKRRLGFDDRWVSRLLGALQRRPRR
jgi:hypothetical protein